MAETQAPHPNGSTLTATLQGALPINRMDGFENLHGAIITDCGDPNAELRQNLRFRALFGVEPAFIALGRDNPDLQAGGDLIDALDSAKLPDSYPQSPFLALVNVAPRGNDVKKRHTNGTPFAHTQIGPNAHVFTTLEGRVLPMLKKLDLADEVEVFDIPAIAEALVERGTLNQSEAAHFTNTQFRSRDSLPKIAYEVLAGHEVPSEVVPIESSEEVDGKVWGIDNFGNIKTTALPEEIGFEEGRAIKLADAALGEEVVCYKRLADVPTGDLGLTIGSSGFGDHRFVELVVQKDSAAQRLGSKIGDAIFRTA